MKYARHHELLRERSTLIILIIAGALLAALKVPGALDIAQVPISLSLIVLGIFGALLSCKHYQKHQEHYGQATEIYDYLFQAGMGNAPRKKAKAKRKAVERGYIKYKRIRLHRLWLTINFLVFAV